MLERSKIRREILEKPCERCGEKLDKDADFVLSFYGGQFIVLHEECDDFIRFATPGPRGVKYTTCQYTEVGSDGVERGCIRQEGHAAGHLPLFLPTMSDR